MNGRARAPSGRPSPPRSRAQLGQSRSARAAPAAPRTGAMSVTARTCPLLGVCQWTGPIGRPSAASMSPISRCAASLLSGWRGPCSSSDHHPYPASVRSVAVSNDQRSTPRSAASSWAARAFQASMVSDMRSPTKHAGTLGQTVRVVTRQTLPPASPARPGRAGPHASPAHHLGHPVSSLAGIKLPAARAFRAPIRAGRRSKNAACGVGPHRATQGAP